MKPYLEILMNNWEFLAPVIYEILARVWPTRWNISLLDNGWKILNWIIPNLRKKKGNEMMVNEKQNFVPVNINKHVLKALLVLFMFAPLIRVDAQIWQNFKGVRLVNNSDTTNQLAVQGSIFYDDVNDTFWGRDNWGWKPFNRGGSGGGITNSAAANQVTISDGTNIFGSTNLTWDNTNGALTIKGARIARQTSSAVNSGVGLYIGNNTGKLNTFAVSRLNNVAIGENALSNIIDGANFYNAAYNTAVGVSTLKNQTTGGYNSAFGFEALMANTTGLQSAAFGYHALRNATAPGANTAFGYLALTNCTTGNENTAVGRTALTALTTGVRNVAVGPCLQGLTTGNYNVSGGSESYERLTTQTENTGWGHWTGVYNRGNSNTSVGAFSFGQTTIDAPTNTASRNAFFGALSARFHAVGNDNTWIGYNSGTTSAIAIQGSIAIGANAAVSQDYSFSLGSAIDAERVNYGFGGESYGSGKGVLFVKNAVTNPISNPVNGFLMYSNAGVATLFNSTGAAFPVGNISGTMVSAAIPFGSGANTLSAENALTYNTAANQILLVNPASTHTTSIFGGELQIDNPSASDNLTINNEGLYTSGLATPYEIVSTSGVELDGDITLTPASTASQLYSGTYSPTGTNVANTSSVLPSSGTGFFRVGNTVTVFGIVNVTPTVGAGTETIWTQTLPIPSDFTGTNDAAGTFTGRENDGSPLTQFPGSIIADATADEIRFAFSSSSTTAIGFSYTYSYQVK